MDAKVTLKFAKRNAADFNKLLSKAPFPMTCEDTPDGVQFTGLTPEQIMVNLFYAGIDEGITMMSAEFGKLLATN